MTVETTWTDLRMTSRLQRLPRDGTGDAQPVRIRRTKVMREANVWRELPECTWTHSELNRICGHNRNRIQKTVDAAEDHPRGIVQPSADWCFHLSYREREKAELVGKPIGSFADAEAWARQPTKIFKRYHIQLAPAWVGWTSAPAAGVTLPAARPGRRAFSRGIQCCAHNCFARVTVFLAWSPP